MSNCIKLDATAPNSYLRISEFLCNELSHIISSRRTIIILCIGTDRCIGDSLGPIIGYKLKHLKSKNLYIYGSLNAPIHAKNINDIINKINNNFLDPYIIAIDACLGSSKDIGKVIIKDSPIFPGLALNKGLSPVGNLSITGIVNIASNYEFTVLQNTRLNTVMSLADCIHMGINDFIIKSFNNIMNILEQN